MAPLAELMGMKHEGHAQGGAVLALCLLSCLFLAPIVHASPTLTAEDGTVYLSCVEDDDCLLSPTPVGEELVSDSVFASPAQPETVSIEFDMLPAQTDLALLPTTLSRMEIDLRFTGDATGVAKPSLDIALILGQTVTEWEFDAQPLPDQTQNEPFVLTDEALNLNGQRLLWP